MPAWSLVVGISVAVSVTAALLILPTLLAPGPDFALVPKSNDVIIYAFHCSGPPSPCYYNGTTLTIEPVRGFTGIVTLNALASNPGIAFSVGSTGTDIRTLALPTTVSLGPATDLGLGAGSATVGNYTITLTASSGPITHTLIVPVLVQNITVALSATSLTIARGSSATVQMMMTSVNRAAPGTLTMTGNVPLSFGQVDPNITVSFNPPSLTLQPGALVTTTLIVNVGPSASTGNRAVSVTVHARYGFGFYIPLTVT